MLAAMRAVAVAYGMTAAAWAQKFEVATIKQAQMISAAEMRTGNAHLGLRVSGMRVEIRLNSLRSMIRLAYGVSDDQIVGPPSIGSPSWNVEAKIPEGATRAQVPQMLQALLAERFHLKVHQEMREQPVWAVATAPEGTKLATSARGEVPQLKRMLTMDYMLNELHVQATRNGDESALFLTGNDGDLTITTKLDRTRI